LETAGQKGDTIRFVNMLAFLSAMTGLGWSSALFIFDSSVMDRNLDLRLIIIGAALTFPVASLAVFKRVFFGYFLGIAIPVVLFIVTRDYLRTWEVLLPSGLFYMAMIAMVSLKANRQKG